MGTSITSARGDVRDPGRSASPVASALTLGAAAAGASFLPSSFVRMPKAQGVLTVMSTLAGLGLGAAAAGPIDALGGGDAVQGGLLTAGAGALAFMGSRGLRGIGGPLRDMDHVVSTLGTIGVATGATTAATAAVGADAGGIDLGDVGIAAGAAALTGGMALAMHKASPPAALAEAARTTVRLSPEEAARWTPESALARYDTAKGIARDRFMGLPGGTPNAWDGIARGRTFLAETPTAREIEKTMGNGPARQPRRLYVGVNEAATPQARADLVLRRFDAVDGASFDTVHVVSPTAMGDTNPVVPLATEFGTRGNVVTLAVQSSSTNPAKAMHLLDDSEETTRLVLAGLRERLAASPDTRVLLSGICYGAVAPARMARETASGSLSHLGVDGALLMAPPGAFRDVRSLAGATSRGETDGVMVREIAEIDRARAAGLTPPLTMVFNRDDSLRTGLHSFVVPPTDAPRPFVPVVTGLATLMDGMQPATVGRFLEVNHQLRASGTHAADLAFDLGLTAGQVERIDQRAVLDEHLRALANGTLDPIPGVAP